MCPGVRNWSPVKGAVRGNNPRSSLSRLQPSCRRALVVRTGFPPFRLGAVMTGGPAGAHRSRLRAMPAASAIVDRQTKDLHPQTGSPCQDLHRSCSRPDGRTHPHSVPVLEVKVWDQT